MSDQTMMNSSPAPLPDAHQSVLPPSPRPRNTRTAWMIGAAGLVVLAAMIGIVAYVVLSASSSVVPAAGPVVPVTPGSTAPTSTATETVSPVPATDNGDVFTPRNPFKVINPAKIASTSNDDSSNDGSNEETSSSTALTLSDISTEDGAEVAVVKLGGTQYSVAEGEKVGTSDWQVVQINTSSVVFLYGDDRITISLGQGTSK